MLVLARKYDERVIIDGGRIVITVVEIDRHRGKVKLGFEAPPGVIIDREEVHREKVRLGRV